jgi:SsrA-binding protein
MSAKSGGAKPRASEAHRKIVADNRRARFDYEILDTFEAGLVLLGSEVKSLRQGRASLADSYASVEGGELWLVNSHIPEFKQANRLNHEPRRPRKLLLNKREIHRLTGGIQREGLTIVPLKVYFNDRGRAKAEVALARGKKLHDKRETEKQRSWDRERSRLLREKG